MPICAIESDSVAKTFLYFSFLKALPRGNYPNILVFVRKFFSRTGGALVLFAAGMLAPAAQAEGLQSHSVVYDVKLAKPDKDVFVEGTASFTLTKRCDGWTLGEILQLGVDKALGAGAQKALSKKADRLEERVNAQESLDGQTLTYETRLHQNARITIATGKATLGPDGGKLTVDLGRYKQDSDLPAGTLAPAAARAALLDALVANKPQVGIRGIDLLRFHKPIAQSFFQLPPQDLAIARTLPKDLRTSDKDFANGRLWALLRRVAEFNEFGDELWLLHQSGAIVRQMIQREGVKLLLEAREITLFPAPTCK
jgi:hypothetical protein